MKLDLKGIIESAKTTWKNLSARSKKAVVIISASVLTVAVLVTAFFAFSKMQYKVLFPGMSNEESAQVYATLQEMGVQPQIDTNGQISVPAAQWDDLVFQLNGKGYPRTTLSYDTFSSVSGFTSTEFEKRTGLIFQAQDRMQQTLIRQDGIEEATVTFTVPESSNYIWDESNNQQSSAGVSVLMKPGYELTPERVTAIKHLAATSVPKLSAGDVVVVNAATGVEVYGVDDTETAGYYNVRRLEFEEQICKKIEDDIRRLLSGTYGPDGVTAVATVTLDYDKMVTETKRYEPRANGEAGGVMSHLDENYSIDGTVPAEGIVGEEDNTDAPPVYPNEDGNGDTSVTDYSRNIDYDVSYVLTQLEKGEPILKSASVAVIVDSPTFNNEEEETLIGLISKAVNITTDNIRVTNLNFGGQEEISPPTLGNGLSQRQLILIALCAVFFVLLILLVIILLVRRARKRKQREEEELEAAEIQRQQELDREIEEHKRMLQSEAMASTNPKEDAITEEVREFASENPEITAALLRSLLREEK